MRFPLGFSALFHQSSHFGFAPSSFEPVFALMLGHVHPEMVFVSTYSIYRRSLNG